MEKKELKEMSIKELSDEFETFGIGVEKGFQTKLKAGRRNRAGAGRDLDPDFTHARWIALLKEMDKRDLP
jgi:hypothetical protein